MRTTRTLLLALLFALSAGSNVAADNPPKLRVLILSGRNNHDWRQTTPALKAILEASGRFAADVTEEPARQNAASLEPYDVLVSNWSSWPDVQEHSWGSAMEQAVMDFVRQGKGLVVFHAATATFQSWPEFQRLVGSTWDTNKTGHGSIHTFKVTIRDDDHPITRGLPGFYTTDELWHRAGLQPRVHVLATAYSDLDKKGSGADEPIALCSELGRGRCFNLILGHDAAAMRQAGWRALMTRGAEWAATGRVTLEPPADLAVREDAASLVGLGPGPLQFTVNPQHLYIHEAARLDLSYHYASVPFKPYVEVLFSPRGAKIIRDAPFDHLHHHGLMYAMQVNGLDFWGEAGTVGRQVHRSFDDKRVDTFKQVPRATFAESIDWFSSTNAACLLTEQRTISWLEPLSTNLTFLEWESRFTLPEGTNEVRLSGVHYHGLGMRFVRDMDSVGTFFNSSGKPGDIFRGEERLVEADWCAYTAPVDGKLVTVAMLAHPSNPRGPTTWFTMAKAFAYLAATLRLHEKPFQLQADHPLTLRYAVAVWEGRVDPDRIQELREWWIK